MIYRFGKYPRWYSTSGLESNWLIHRYGDEGIDYPESQYDVFDRVVIGTLNGIQWSLNKTINRFNEFRGQKVRVHVEDHDVWSVDVTIANMALPLLEKLRDESYGYPVVDPIDVPSHLKPSMHEYKEYLENHTLDDKAFLLCQ